MVAKSLPIIREASHCFGFEIDFTVGWRCIPLCVRRKLDLAGIKLKLRHWLALEQSERQQLVDWPDAPADLHRLALHLKQRTATMADGCVKDLPKAQDQPWQQQHLPQTVATAARRLGRPFQQQDWETLSELQRFALCTLSRPGHDHRNLGAALAEVSDHPGPESSQGEEQG